MTGVQERTAKATACSRTIQLQHDCFGRLRNKATLSPSFDSRGNTRMVK
jgi:hypothetical protein